MIIKQDELIFLIFFGMLGALYNFSKQKLKDINKNTLILFIVSFSTSIGLVFTIYLLLDIETKNENVKLGLAGVSAYLGIRLLSIIENLIITLIEDKFNVKIKERNEKKE